MAAKRSALESLQKEVISCKKCTRLITHCTSIAAIKKREFRDWTYWGKPVPGFGDPAARLWIVGLAPAAHGANRTGRMFTGDKSGDWLYKALHETGFASQPTSGSADDGLSLSDAYISAAGRCAPPDNKPTPEELANCSEFLKKERALLENVQVIVALGRIAFDAIYPLVGDLKIPKSKREFGHARWWNQSEIPILMSYHPSRQNTQTGRLTWEMWHSVFAEVRKLLDGETTSRPRHSDSHRRTSNVDSI